MLKLNQQGPAEGQVGTPRSTKGATGMDDYLVNDLAGAQREYIVKELYPSLK